DVEFVRVVASRPGVRGLEVAQGASLPTTVVARREHSDTDAFSRQLDEVVIQDEPDLVVMAGFLSLWRLPDALRGKVINIHPSLLPAFGGKGFYGRRVHEAVLEAGVRLSGCTVHFVDDRYDQGPIILQQSCEVLPDDDADTLAARVFSVECLALPKAIRGFAAKRYRCEGQKTTYEGPIDW
ncbi:MAG: phosphoribosylglycinamide formyltransferase, partial [Salinibacterium sp.]|nr:phosphoribosylglycinamide formyltransferase [Salinibacterium sp.]